MCCCDLIYSALRLRLAGKVWYWISLKRGPALSNCHGSDMWRCRQMSMLSAKSRCMIDDYSQSRTASAPLPSTSTLQAFLRRRGYMDMDTLIR